MQTFPEVRKWGLAAARLVGPLLLVSACSDGPYLQTENYVTRDGEEQYMGGGCVAVQAGSGMGGGTAPVPGHGGEDGEGSAPLTPGFSFSYEGTGNSVRFTVTDGFGVPVAERDYDSNFLLSGQKEEIAVDVTDGKLRFVHWGGAKCGETRPPTPE